MSESALSPAPRIHIRASRWKLEVLQGAIEGQLSQDEYDIWRLVEDDDESQDILASIQYVFKMQFLHPRPAPLWGVDILIEDIANKIASKHAIACEARSHLASNAQSAELEEVNSHCHAVVRKYVRVDMVMKIQAWQSDCMDDLGHLSFTLDKRLHRLYQQRSYHLMYDRWDQQAELEVAGQELLNGATQRPHAVLWQEL